MGESAADGGEDDSHRVWRVEWTYSSDSPNILVIICSTPDGMHHLQKEWAFNRFGSGPAPEVTAAIEGEQEAPNPVENLERREQFATEADRMQ